MKPRNYKVIGLNKSFSAASDKEAAVIVAAAGDYGFVDHSGLEKFPATWTEEEWGKWLGAPLGPFLATHGAVVAPIVAYLKS